MFMQKGVYKFPCGFLWGAATSAHQVEGGNLNNWSEWEKEQAPRLARAAERGWTASQREKFPEMLKPENYISGVTADHYCRFEEDFVFAKSLDQNAHRFSLEWSRLEPEKGRFDQAAIDHYSEVLDSLRQKGLEPFVTINHWTLPLWLSRAGGWDNSEAVLSFGKLVDHLAKTLGHQITFWLTLNEPWIFVGHSYLRGLWPPQKKNIRLAYKIFKNLVGAHKTAYNIIKSYHPEARIGLAENLVDFEGWPSFLAGWLNRRFLASVSQRLDFIGVNYCFHHKMDLFGRCRNRNDEVSDLGWEIYPEGLYRVLKKMKKYRKPVYVTENGLADASDEKRAKFIKGHIYWLYRAIQEGVDVRGYFYWSLLDNFEWDKGFWPRFGLIEVDYRTRERKIRPSAREYAKICKENHLVL